MEPNPLGKQIYDMRLFKWTLLHRLSYFTRMRIEDLEATVSAFFRVGAFALLHSREASAVSSLPLYQPRS